MECAPKLPAQTCQDFAETHPIFLRSICRKNFLKRANNYSLWRWQWDADDILEIRTDTVKDPVAQIVTSDTAIEHQFAAFETT